MSRHVLDRTRTPATDRAQRYLEAERREGLHPATRTLLKRERPETGAKTRAFVKIERSGGQD